MKNSRRLHISSFEDFPHFKYDPRIVRHSPPRHSPPPTFTTPLAKCDVHHPPIWDNLAPAPFWHRYQFGTGVNLTPDQFDTKSTKESIWHQECKRDNLGGINFDCCLWALSGPEGGRAQLLKMCIQFNILDPILICVPNIWGSYQLWLLSLGPMNISARNTSKWIFLHKKNKIK